MHESLNDLHFFMISSFKNAHYVKIRCDGRKKGDCVEGTADSQIIFHIITYILSMDFDKNIV